MGTELYSEDTQRQTHAGKVLSATVGLKGLSLTQEMTSYNLKQGRGEPEEVPSDSRDSIAVQPHGCDRPLQ